MAKTKVRITYEELGKCGYDAYRAHTGGKSLATGQPIPDWDHLSPEIQAAWEASGKSMMDLLARAVNRILEEGSNT